MKSILKSFPLYLLASAFFLATHGYRGIDADGRLYLLQVVHGLHPGRLSTDLAFMSGNQDEFSLFSFVYKFFLNAFGIESGTRYLFFVISILWACSLLYLLRSALRRYRLELWALPFFALFVTASHYYGYGPWGYPVFEKICVARPLSEALSLLGLGLLFADRRTGSLIAFIFGTLIHPLMGGWCLAVWLFFRFPGSRLPVLIVSLLCALFVFVGKGDFAPYDSVWAGWLGAPGRLLPTKADVLRLLLKFGLLVFVWWNMKDLKLKRLSLALLCVGMIAFYFAFIASATNFILLVKLQTWRYEWILSVMVLVLFALLFPQWLAARPVEISYKLVKIVAAAFAVLLFLYSIYDSFLSLNILGVIEFPVLLNVSQKTFIDGCLVSLAGLVLVYKSISLPSRNFLMPSNFALLPLGLFLLFPETPMLLAVASLLIALADVNLQRKYIAAICVLSVALILVNLQDSRLFSLVTRYSLCDVHLLTGLALPLSVILAGIYSLCRSGRIRALVVAGAFVLGGLSCAVAYAGWDQRLPGQYISERQMQQFWDKPVFPQVQDRGKIFFYSSGFALPWGRSQFLSGAYIDGIANIGEVFYRRQYIDFRSRSRKIQCKNESDTKCRIKSLDNYLVYDLSDRDTLIDMLAFLCATKEIEYIVTDINDLPYKKEDSTYLNVQRQMDYLYHCASVDQIG